MKLNTNAKKGLSLLLVGVMLATALMAFTGCDDAESYSSSSSSKPSYSYGSSSSSSSKPSYGYGSSSSSSSSSSSNKGSSSSSSSSSKCGHSSCAINGPFYCMGKNDTCPNKTYCAYDYYCDSCD